MGTGLKIGKIFGIPIELHVSWFLIFAMVTWSLASGLFPQEYPNMQSGLYWVLGVVTSLLFFGSVLLHELGHSVVALRDEVPVRKITLFIFGGLAQIEKEPPTSGSEFRIAIAGPLVSLALAGFFGLLWLLDKPFSYLAAPSIWLARINLMLALFNMIPGFPLDGGRVLRAILWQRIGNFYKATRIAGRVGSVVAYGFIGFGALTIFNGNFINGMWLIFIGFFLQNAASNNVAVSSFREALHGTTVGRVMTYDFPKVPGNAVIQQLVDEQVLSTGQRYFMVADNDQLEGLLTLRDITKIPQRQWRFTAIRNAMVPLERLITVSPQQELWEALQTMDTNNINQVPVCDDNEIRGVLSREQIVRYVRLRSELGV